jgi:hypothetical protein
MSAVMFIELSLAAAEAGWLAGCPMADRKT